MVMVYLVKVFFPTSPKRQTRPARPNPHNTNPPRNHFQSYLMDSSKTARFPPCLLLVIIIAATTSSSTFAQQTSFKCSTDNTTCTALVDYVTPNTTTLSAIANLFSLSTTTPILGANNLVPSTNPSSHTVPANSTIKIPFPCRCNNGTGISDAIPIYTVVKDDGLYHIAAEVFSGLVTFQQIQAANTIIVDPNKIEVGWRLHIPLPCSCDEVVPGQSVVHYGHVVVNGSSLEGIAQQYGTSQDVLQRLNNLTGPQGLLAGSVIDVPLRACSSSVSKNSMDYPLLVTNGTYVNTARDCVTCRCDASNNWILKCEPSHINSTCPAAIQCNGDRNLYLGNSTSSGCNRTTCAYAGYNPTIQTTLFSDSTCPAPGNGNRSSATNLRGSTRTGILIISIVHALILCVLFL